jgi:hypothetical protein
VRLSPAFFAPPLIKPVARLGRLVTANHMIYATACFWLAMTVLLAWGVHSIWLGMVKPKTFNIALLPGTLVSTLGRIVALLITGATVHEAAKATDGEKTESPGAGPIATTVPKLPVVGPCIVAMLPMMLLGILTYAVGMKLGGAFLGRLPVERIPTELPLSTAQVWEQLRNLTYVSESLMSALGRVDSPSWKTFVFIYLLTCFTIRMAPFPGNIRGHVGAVLSAGLLAFLAGSVYPRLPERIATIWPILALTVGWLTLLLILSLLARGTVMTFKAMAKPSM